MIERLKEILKKYKFSYWKILKHENNKDLMDFIDNWSDKLNGHKLSTKIFWILHNIHDFPCCKECGKQLTRDSDIQLEDGCYHTYCGNKCATKSKDRNNKRKETNIKRYGFPSPAMNNEVKQKMFDTNIERYGCKSTFESEIVKEKSRKTCSEKYGVEHCMKLESVKQKIRDTCLKKYGTVNGGCSEEALEKIKATNMKRYGVKSSFDRKEVRDKSRNTLLKKYGKTSYLGTTESCKFKIGSLRKSYYDTLMNNEYDEPLFSLEEYVEKHLKNKYAELSFRCKKCGRTFLSFHINGIHRKCPHCYVRTENFEENELFDFLKSIYKGNIIHGIGGKKTIYPLELDFYIPEKNIAIEFDGLYWHSEKSGKDSSYHLHKTEECEKLNIQLIHVFEDEWIQKNEIVKNRLQNLIGVYEKTIFARKCHVKEIDWKTSDRFMNENHIQGSCSSKINLGLYYENELVSVMTLGKPRFNRKYEWELLRFCNKGCYHVIGGAGKLLKHFEINYRPKSLISYADRRWSVGKLYEKLGFKCVCKSKPAYFYIKQQNRFSRVIFQKHKLKEKLEVFDNILSEVENMHNNGYYRIWDCGNMVFVKEYNFGII